MQDLTQMSDDDLGDLSNRITRELQLRANVEVRKQAIVHLEEFNARLNVQDFFKRAKLCIAVTGPGDVSDYLRPNIAFQKDSVLGLHLRQLIDARPQQHLMIEVRDLGGPVYLRLANNLTRGSHSALTRFMTDPKIGRYVLHYTPPHQKSDFDLPDDQLPVRYVDTSETLCLEISADYQFDSRHVTETDPFPIS